MSKYPGRIITDLAPAGYSVYFDGSGDRIQTASNAALALGSNDFSIEWWERRDVIGSEDTPVLTGDYPSGYTSCLLGYSGTAGYISTNGASWNVLNGPAYVDPVLPNVWNHFVYTRSGTNFRVFMNGKLSNYVTGSGSVVQNSNRFNIGGTASQPQFDFPGYISNFRVVIGSIPTQYQTSSTTVGTVVFTPPTQLFPVTNTVLLTCNSPTIVDQSSSAIALTVSGNAAVSTVTPFPAYVPYNPALGAATPGVWTVDEAMQAAATRQWNMYDPNFPNTTLLLHGNPPANVPTVVTDASANNFAVTAVGDARASGLSPFSLTTYPSSGSAYLDGTGDYFSIADNVALDMGSSDFTIEFWTYVTGTPSTYQAYFGKRANTGTYGGVELYLTSSRNLNLQATLNGSTWGVDITTSSTVSLNTWTHVAAVRNGNTWIVYINGTAGATSGTVSGTIPDNANAFVIGAGASDGGHPMIAGYISNFRVVKGTAVYTSNFTPSTAPLTAITNTSLLTLQNSQSANNNAFLDSSSNNFLITRNGNATQGSFSPFSQTGWSVNYGVSNYWQAPASTNWDITGAAFTVEMWVYLTGFTTDVNQGVFLIGNYTGSGGASGWSIGASSGASPLFQFTYWNGGGGTNINSTATIPLNAWTHLAVTRSSNTIFFYMNGVSVGSAAAPSIAAGDKLTSGAYTQNFSYPSWVYGSISNLRIIKGTALYSGTGSFTPPTGPLTAVANTVFLGNQSNRFIDNGPNAVTITPSGTVATQPFSPFYPTVAYTPQTIGGGGSFDGTGDNLTVAGNAAFAFGTGDFTLEAWIYPNSISTGTFDRVCATSDFNGSGFDWTLNTGSSSLFLASSSYGFAINVRSWNHIVYTRSGTTLRGFLNGRLAVYNASASQNITSTTSLLVGQGYSGTNFNGFMTDLRIIKGSIPTSYQTSATTTGTQVFTPPTAPLTTTSQGATANNVVLLLNMTNAGVVESAAKMVFETAGNAQISTARSRFGGSSLLLDGTGDALYIPSSQKENLLFGTGNFTIEFWAWKSADGSSSYDTVISVGSTGNYNGGFAVELSATRGFCFIYDAAVRISSSLNPNDSTWHHYAVVRNGSTFALYRDGVQLTSATLTPTLGVTGEAWIGSGVTSTGSNFNGYLEELRVTRGIARYTAAFTLQTSQWQDQ